MDKQQEFIALSRYAGERFDLVQAGGGNSSVKLDDGMMLIKSSGYSLSELSENRGYTKVDLPRILAILSDKRILESKDKREQETLASSLLMETQLDANAKPSIETFLHALLHPFTLHTHPLIVNAITCRKDWETILAPMFPQALLVPYETPGIKLALALKERLLTSIKHNGEIPSLVFLQNHGLIVSAPDPRAVRTLTESVLTRLEGYLGIEMDQHKLVSKVSVLFVGAGPAPIAYLSHDGELSRHLAAVSEQQLTPFCPDGFVFCGIHPLRLKDLENPAPIHEYRARHHEDPKVVLYGDQVFFIAPSVRKAREIEEVFKFHLAVLRLAGDQVLPLHAEELAYLGNWEAEKYRQTL